MRESLRRVPAFFAPMCQHGETIGMCRIVQHLSVSLAFHVRKLALNFGFCARLAQFLLYLQFEKSAIAITGSGFGHAVL